MSIEIILKKSQVEKVKEKLKRYLETSEYYIKIDGTENLLNLKDSRIYNILNERVIQDFYIPPKIKNDLNQILNNYFLNKNKEITEEEKSNGISQKLFNENFYENQIEKILKNLIKQN